MFAATLLASLALVVGQAPEEPALILRGSPPVNSAVFSSDGKRLAVAAQDLEVYDVATGKLTLRVPQAGGTVSFSPDGRWLCSVDSTPNMLFVDGTARLYDSQTGKPGHTFNATTAATFSRDSRWLVLEGRRAVSGEKELAAPRIGDVATGKTHPAELPARPAGMFGDAGAAWFAFTRNGKQLAQLSPLAQKEWPACELATGRKIENAKAPALDAGDLLRVVPQPGSQAFFQGGFTLLDLASGKTLHTYERTKKPGEAYCVYAQTVHADRRLLFLAMAQHDDGIKTHLATVDLDKATIQPALELDTAPWFNLDAYAEGVQPLSKNPRKKGARGDRDYATVRIDPTGRVAASMDSAGVLTIWDLAKKQAMHRLRDTGHRASVSLLSFRHDSKVLATGYYKDPVLLWDLANGRQLAALAPHPTLMSLAFRPGSDQLVGSGWGGAQTWDTHARQVVRTFPSEHAGHFAFTPDGKRLAVSLSDHEIAILDADSGKRVGGIVAKREGSPKPPQRRFILALHYTPDGKQLAFFDFDGAIRFHDSESSKALHVAWSQGNDHLSDFQFTADGAKLLVQSGHNALQLFDAKTGKWILNVVENKQRMLFALHPDGKRVALGSLDGAVKEIDLATQKPLRTLASHHRPVAMLAYSPDGRLLATAGWDCDVRVWNVPAK